MRKWLTLLFYCLFSAVVLADTVVYDSSGQFVVPQRVESIDLQIWGGGGAGTNLPNNIVNAGGGGGGAGAFSVYKKLKVIPGKTYAVNVGQGGTLLNVNGGNSSFSAENKNAFAIGGNGAVGNNGGNGAPFSANADFSIAGGDGGDGVLNAGGGGGGSGNETTVPTNGSNAIANVGGIGGSIGGGSGGKTNVDAQNGSYYGAGGGGGGRNSISGNGHSGCIIITYEVPHVVLTDIATGYTFDNTYGKNSGVVIYRPLPGIINDGGKCLFRAYAKVGIAGVTSDNDELLIMTGDEKPTIIYREGDVLNNFIISNASYRNQRYRSFQLCLTPDDYAFSSNMFSLQDGTKVPLHTIYNKNIGFNLLTPDNILQKQYIHLGPIYPMNSGFVYGIKRLNVINKNDCSIVFDSVNGSETKINEGQNIAAINGNLGEISSNIVATTNAACFIANIQTNNRATNQALFKYTNHGGVEAVARKGDFVNNGSLTINSFSSVSMNSFDRVGFIVNYSKFGQALLIRDGALQTRCILKSESLNIKNIFGLMVLEDNSIIFTASVKDAIPSQDCMVCKWDEINGIRTLVREGDYESSTNSYFHTLLRLSVNPYGTISLHANMCDSVPWTWRVSPKAASAIFRIINNRIEKVLKIGENVNVNDSPQMVRSMSTYQGDLSINHNAFSINDEGWLLVSLSFGGGIHMNKVFKP